MVKSEKKQVSKLKMEINGMKDDFKKCMEDLKKETYARNEAETLLKVLKDTQDAKSKLEGAKEIVEMDVDEKYEELGSDGGEWSQQRKQKKKMKKRSRRQSGSEKEEEVFNCNICAKVVASKTELDSHKETHTNFDCTQCDRKFRVKGDLFLHLESHVQNGFKCKQCGEVFHVEDSLRDHEQNHCSTGPMFVTNAMKYLLYRVI